MDPAECMQALLDLATEVGLEVRVVGGRRVDGEPAPQSALCVVRGRPWVVLASHEPVGAQVDVLSEGLRRFGGESLLDRYLPPAVRAALEPEEGA